MRFETILSFFIAIFAGIITGIVKLISFGAKAGYKYSAQRYREDHKGDKNRQSNSMLVGAGVAVAIVVLAVGVILLLMALWSHTPPDRSCRVVFFALKYIQAKLTFFRQKHTI